MLLAVSSVVKNFAPTHESLTINVTAPSNETVQTMTLSVSDADSSVVYTRQINGYQGQLTWDGSLNDNSIDATAEPYATPLRSPYTLTVDATTQPMEIPDDLSSKESGHVENVKCSKKKDEVDENQKVQVVLPTSVRVAVLYAKIELRHGKWNADGQNFNANSAEDVCNRLNLLGYYAGPPARCGTDDTLLKRAKARFRRNSKTLIGNANPSDQDYVQALTAAANAPLPTLVADDLQPIAADAALSGPGAKPMRVFVEAPGFEGAEFDDQYKKNNPTNRTSSTSTRLNRPLIPVDAVIKLKASDSSAVDAPRAVGAVRVDFEIFEGRENFDLLPLTPSMQSYARSYVRQMLMALADRGERNTNCPQEYGGIRPKNRDAGTAFWMEAQPYAPYAAPQKDGKVVHTAAHAGTVAACRGRAGVYLQPSIIAGDRYRLTASLKFGGGRADALAIANPVPAAESAFIEVWRRAEVAALVGWPQRNNSDIVFKSGMKYYTSAYTLLDTTSTLFATMSQVCDDNDYKAFIAHLGHYAKDSLFQNMGKVCDLTALGTNPLMLQVEWKSIGSNSEFFRLVTILFESIGSGNQASPADWLMARLTAKVIAARNVEHPVGGMVMLEYLQHADVISAVKAIDPTVPTMSNGLADLRAIVDQAGPGVADYIVAHEAGHCFWLRHHENAGRTNAPDDHDPLDHGCMMSYTVGDDDKKIDSKLEHQRESKYKPRFCGKCNLKLRGWDIAHADFPKAQKRVQTMNLAICYDASEPALRAAEEVDAIRDAWAAVSRGEWTESSVNLATTPRSLEEMLQAYATAMKDSHVFHHISHGNIRCSACKVPTLTMNVATPRYPTLCPADPRLVARFCRECGTLFDNHELKETVLAQRGNKAPKLEIKNSRPILYAAIDLYQKQKKSWGELVRDLATPLYDEEVDHVADEKQLAQWCGSMLFPGDKTHPLESAVQWTAGPNASGKDLEMTCADFQKVLKSTKPPTTLMFFSCGLMGWDSTLAQLFVKAGTQYVIAFRSRYQPTHAIEFTKTFYRTWVLDDFNPKALPEAFKKAATECPHAEPVLCSKDFWMRARPATMKNGSGEILTMKPGAMKEFTAPRFPKR